LQIADYVLVAQAVSAAFGLGQDPRWPLLHENGQNLTEPPGVGCGTGCGLAGGTACPTTAYQPLGERWDRRFRLSSEFFRSLGSVFQEKIRKLN